MLVAIIHRTENVRPKAKKNKTKRNEKFSDTNLMRLTLNSGHVSLQSNLFHNPATTFSIRSYWVLWWCGVVWETANYKSFMFAAQFLNYNMKLLFSMTLILNEKFYKFFYVFVKENEKTKIRYSMLFVVSLKAFQEKFILMAYDFHTIFPCHSNEHLRWMRATKNSVCARYAIILIILHFHYYYFWRSVDFFSVCTVRSTVVLLHIVCVLSIGWFWCHYAVVLCKSFFRAPQTLQLTGAQLVRISKQFGTLLDYCVLSMI